MWMIALCSAVIISKEHPKKDSRLAFTITKQLKDDHSDVLFLFITE